MVFSSGYLRDSSAGFRIVFSYKKACIGQPGCRIKFDGWAANPMQAREKN
jgi:hypothetical protein